MNQDQYNSLLEKASNERRREKKLYIVQGGPFFKIGVSHDHHARVKDINVGNPYKCTVILSVTGSNAERLERLLHSKYNDVSMSGEWFALTEKHFAELCSICKKEKFKVKILNKPLFSKESEKIAWLTDKVRSLEWENELLRIQVQNFMLHKHEIENCIVPYGSHKGKFLKDAIKEDYEYFKYCHPQSIKKHHPVFANALEVYFQFEKEVLQQVNPFLEG